MVATVVVLVPLYVDVGLGLQLIREIDLDVAVDSRYSPVSGYHQGTV